MGPCRGRGALRAVVAALVCANVVACASLLGIEGDLTFDGSADGSIADGADGVTTGSDGAPTDGGPTTDTSFEATACAPGAMGPSCARIVFVTPGPGGGDGVIGGFLLGDEGATTLCNAVATASTTGPTLRGRSFVPWLGVQSKSAAAHLSEDWKGPYLNANGEVVATSKGALLTEPLVHPIMFDAVGAATHATAVWTGAFSDGGTQVGGNCMSFSTTSAGPGALGIPDATSPAWSAGVAGTDCSSEKAAIYCFENYE